MMGGRERQSEPKFEIENSDRKSTKIAEKVIYIHTYIHTYTHT